MRAHQRRSEADPRARTGDRLSALFGLGLMLATSACQTSAEAPVPGEPASSQSSAETEPPALTGPARAVPGGLLVTGSDGSITIIDELGVVVETVAAGHAPTDPDPPPMITVQPTSSPDGSSIAYSPAVPNAETGSPDSTQIWSDGETQPAALAIHPFYYDWSPDGERFVALGNAVDGVGGLVFETATEDVLDIGSASPYFLAWSPDGRHLAAHRDGGDLVAIDLEGSETILTVKTGVFQAPEWLDDRTILAVISSPQIEVAAGPAGEAQANHIVAISIDGGQPTVIGDTGPSSAFALSPDSSRLAVLSGPIGPLLVGSLKVIDVATGDVTTISEESVLTFQWSPDGRRLLVGKADDQGTIKPAVWDGTTPMEFDAYRPSSVFLTQYLPFWGQYVRRHQPWSPTSDAFAYASVSADESAVVVIQELDGSQPRIVGGGVHVSWLP